MVEPGNEAEFTLNAHPGRIIKATVDSIVWAQGQGQVPNSDAAADDRLRADAAGALPGQARGRREGSPTCSCPAGAVGHGAIYTEHGHAIQILRKVILRVGAKLDYLVLKLH